MVCACFTNARIADRMGTSEQTIKNRMREILRKAGRHNRCELILFVFRNGVVECPCTQRQSIAETSACHAGGPPELTPPQCEVLPS